MDARGKFGEHEFISIDRGQKIKVYVLPRGGL